MRTVTQQLLHFYQQVVLLKAHVQYSQMKLIALFVLLGHLVIMPLARMLQVFVSSIMQLLLPDMHKKNLESRKSLYLIGMCMLEMELVIYFTKMIQYSI
jgi:hypothetical protein